MTSVAVPMCYSCVHLDPAEEDMVCAAYPAGIPDAILDSQADHRLPYTGDNDIQFAQDPETPEPDWEMLGFSAPAP